MVEEDRGRSSQHELINTNCEITRFGCFALLEHSERSYGRAVTYIIKGTDLI